MAALWPAVVLLSAGWAQARTLLKPRVWLWIRSEVLGVCLQQAAASGDVMNSLRAMMHVEKVYSLPLSQRVALTHSLICGHPQMLAGEDEALQGWWTIITGTKVNGYYLICPISTQFSALARCPLSLIFMYFFSAHDK